LLGQNILGDVESEAYFGPNYLNIDKIAKLVLPLHSADSEYNRLITIRGSKMKEFMICLIANIPV
jgi:hypothetical protein